MHLFFSYTFKMEPCFPAWPKIKTSHASGKQARTCIFGFTCTPGGIFIQLRRQLGVYSLEDARRQIGSERWLLSKRGGGRGPKPTRTLKSEKHCTCEKGPCGSHSSGLPLQEQEEGNLLFTEAFPFVIKFTFD